MLQESLWNFKRDEVINNANVTNDDNAPSFKYKEQILLVILLQMEEIKKKKVEK